MFSIDFYFQILSLVAAVYYYQKKRNKIPLYFIPFLFTTVVVEFLGWWWHSFKGVGNYALYNIFTILEFIFYSLLFYIHFRKPFLKRMALSFIPSFTFLAVLNISFVQGLTQTFNTYAFLLGSFFIVVFCCCFFYESVLPEKIDQQLSKQPLFWICSGLLIYYLGSVIINALFEYLRSNDLREEGKRMYKIINHTLNVVLYSSFCISFYICPDNKKTYSSQLS